MTELNSPTLDGIRRVIGARVAEERLHLSYLRDYPGGYDLGTLAVTYDDQLGRRRLPEDVRPKFVGPRQEVVRLLMEHGFTVSGAQEARDRVQRLREPYEAHDPRGGTYIAQPSGEGFFGRMVEVLDTIIEETTGS